ncbi:hypothetical protein GJ496_006688 [Pomphorhynchus laevis]|nr:hypothetical protein GJ496_006688 [Pomphorhynchus laevis]
MNQLGIVSLPQKCALFLTIHLNRELVHANNLKSIIRSIFKIVNTEKKLNFSYAIGLGNKTVNQLKIATNPFQYNERKYYNGVMPATDGDIFVHLKNDEKGTLISYAIRIIYSIPKQFVNSFEDIYGFTYLDNRDLSGFIDGINNPKTEEDRIKFGVELATHSSYILTQKWVHDMDKLSNIEVSKLEECVGRTLKDGLELENKTDHSHVARMKGGCMYQQSPKFRIVRQSMPFGTISTEAGLFFIAYSKSIEGFEFMLDRMVEKDNEDKCFEFSTATSGNYWFAPSIYELNKISEN